MSRRTVDFFFFQKVHIFQNDFSSLCSWLATRCHSLALHDGTCRNRKNCPSSGVYTSCTVPVAALVLACFRRNIPAKAHFAPLSSRVGPLPSPEALSLAHHALISTPPSAHSLPSLFSPNQPSVVRFPSLFAAPIPSNREFQALYHIPLETKNQYKSNTQQNPAFSGQRA